MAPSSERLPIFAVESEIINALTHHPRLIIQAPTGSGKSTQVPQILHDQNLGNGKQIVILQPRRLATRLLAERVAAERNCKIGEEVGYQIRFENKSNIQTKIKYVTEGILLRQFLVDPSLANIGAIIFDEFHERHLYGDITLARALQVQQAIRPDLKIIVMSATLTIAMLEQYLSPCQQIISHGKTYPVSVEYLTRPIDLKKINIWDLAVKELEQATLKYQKGDVLIFMPGSYEIQRTLQALRNSSMARNCEIFPLHGELSVQDQNNALKKYAKRKIIVSTNVAETSVTIDGIELVIDSGLARIARFDPHRGINTLLIEPISQAAAEQRTGRAGRTAPGHCIRLWSEQEHKQRSLQELPEVKRLDLSEVILTLKGSGITDIATFPWLELPDQLSMKKATTLLSDLGAIEADNGKITTLGEQMLAFPMHPRYSRMLLAAKEYGCVRAVALIAALTQGRHFYLGNQPSFVEEKREELFGKESDSDFFLLMQAWQYAHQHHYHLERCKEVGIHSTAAQQVLPLLENFLEIAQQQGLSLEDRSNSKKSIQKCILLGFSDQLARRQELNTARCTVVHHRKGSISADSIVKKAEIFVAAEIREIEGKELSVVATLLTAIEPHWLEELFSTETYRESCVIYDALNKKVVAQENLMFRDLVLSSEKKAEPSKEQAAQILAEKIIQGQLVLKEWDHSVEQWITRLNCLAKWCPELEIPPIEKEDRNFLITQICLGATSAKQLESKAVWPTVKSWLNLSQLNLLDQYAPERVTLPNQKKIKITYTADDPPFIACRIQDLYGLNLTPLIAMGRVSVIVHILAPNQRPVQVTQDLANFWKETYPKVKQELQRRYPKHEWR
ncbi:MAG: Helicase ATP-dependent domain protein [Chlamydiales bacterium]|jgi:ATP-dependent helicase HrpB|nr:Helicase ATP-dependent domain protein [Chlamydiales bacterium]